MNKTYKTKQGTELPLLNLRGRDYLEVKYRLVWFREEHPDWSIETEFTALTDTTACAKAVVRDSGGRVISTSHKFESEQGFPDFMEKAETGAIGRALALIGYGTQFCADELDEGERIVDSPVAQAVSRGTSEPGEPGDYEVSFGKKYRGRKLSDIPQPEIESYLHWLEAQAEKKHLPLSLEVQQLKKAVELYFDDTPGPLDQAS